MASFPAQMSQAEVIRTFEVLGFRLVCVDKHIAMIRENGDGTKTPLTLPNHPHIKGSTLRICL